MTDSLDKIQILEYQKPALEAGAYKISATHTFAAIPKDPDLANKLRQIDADPRLAGFRDMYKRELLAKSGGPVVHGADTEFRVAGARFGLNPGRIRAQFPPAESQGVYSRVLPHISLRSATLPWERSAYNKIDFEPWMVLLVVDQADIDEDRVRIPPGAATLGQIATEPGWGYDYPPKAGDDPTIDPKMMVNYLRASTEFLDAVMPTGRQMRLQTHVRRREKPNGEAKEISIVFSNRLPKPNSITSCFLVSVEGMYEFMSTDEPDPAHDEAHGVEGKFVNPSGDDYCTLVSLASWQFSSDALAGKNFENLSEDLDTGTLTFAVPDADDQAASRLAQGAALLKHELRSSDHTWSWYRGPLAPSLRRFEYPARLPVMADELLVVDSSVAMFDVSYSAAFELGKALALGHRGLAAALHGYKQNHNHLIARRLEAESNEAFLPGWRLDDHDLDTGEHVDTISQWLDNLALLDGVPFNYLVPDDRMLPPESLRFFYLDPDWIDALLAGAFSIGGAIRNQIFNRDLDEARTKALAKGKLPAADLEAIASYLNVQGSPDSKGTVAFDQESRRGTVTFGDHVLPLSTRSGQVVVRDPLIQRRLFNELVDRTAFRPRSGVLLRSRLVSGWPDMMIDVFAKRPTDDPRKPTPTLQNLRAKRLSPDVLLLVFSGELKVAELYLKPEGLQFGVDQRGDARSKDVETEHSQNPKREVDVTMTEPHRLVDIVDLRNKMADEIEASITTKAGRANFQFDRADFAMQMFEGAPKRRFMRAAP